MPITTLNSQAIPADVIQSSDLDYPLTDFSSTGIDDNATSTAITIDSSENVGIGISSLVNPLQVGVTSNTASKTSGSAFDGGALRLDGGLGGADSEVAILGGSNDGLSSGIGFARQDSSTWATQIRFYTHGTGITTTDELTERMRLDGSGNLLVGTTNNLTSAELSAGETGIAFRSGNLIIASREAGAGLLVNRKTSDGDLIDFRKDGSVVGSIGTKSSGLYIGTEDSGIFFNHHGGGNLDAIFPYDLSTNSFYNGQMNVGGPTNQFGAGYFNYTTIDNGAVYNNFSGASGVAFSGTGTSPCNNAGATTDGVHDLGRSTQRWKDIYLSGDVVQGNTSGGFITFNTGLNGVSQGNTQQTNLFDRATTATAATGTVYVSLENSGANVLWGYIIDFFYSNNTLTATARETGNSQGTTTCTVQANGTAISVSVSYLGGLGGNIRFNAGGHASVCNY